MPESSMLLLPSHKLEPMTQAVVDVCRSALICYCCPKMLIARIEGAKIATAAL